ncbi:Uncharacterized membrane protein YckC, RDD family [Rubritalea squalenifaciens DSM 18772]|uniref:Uncharacterized membrane protein YckC, RDD family n=1 Tax=Rubritalea squalenifaciens DSM 18772 TaxID=1123071 RepID=A0A1M6MAL3_9BACT|nr:RDD family protein [Rubritalea squalenifaciens]SHJ80467.1 Uncharacterized membrane protein YckC, RDD family [Rubritalea squalenifaciens DSM 18772]
MASKEKDKIDTLQSVELGEGVEILLRMAGPFPRAMALLLDYLIIIGVIVVLWIIMSILSSWFPRNVIIGILLLCFFMLGWGYFAFFESGKRGATPGKRALGLRVVDRSGNEASRGQVLVRNLLRFVDMLPGVPSASVGIMIGGYGCGLTSSLLSKKFQRLGDMVANTVVIYSTPVRHLSSAIPPVLKSVAPPVVLTKEEQAAIAAFRERAGLWSEARRIELADHASAVSGSKGREGMTKLLGVAHWLTERD